LLRILAFLETYNILYNSVNNHIGNVH
jgi:hypothetical protein